MQITKQYFFFLLAVMVVAILASKPKVVTAFFNGFGSSTATIIKSPLG